MNKKCLVKIAQKKCTCKECKQDKKMIDIIIKNRLITENLILIAKSMNKKK